MMIVDRQFWRKQLIINAKLMCEGVVASNRSIDDRRESASAAAAPRVIARGADCRSTILRQVSPTSAFFDVYQKLERAGR